jgi:serine/threonine protein phosphatase PrpC/TolA-binding protein
MKITVGKITDKGLNPKREVNEDSLLVMQERGVFLVADGVGGRRGGQVASQTVVDVFTKVFSQELPDGLRGLVINTIDLCNQKIFEETEVNPELKGMATTIALVGLDSKRGDQGGRAIIAHIGDSRVYRYDKEGLVCLTEDHSDVNDALRAGMITEEQAAVHPQRNVINRALGAELDVEPDVVELEVDEYTSFLLCSDGITRHITDQEIARLMRSGRRPEAICESMKELCYMGGAEDNLTAIIIDLGERDYVEEPTRPAMRTVGATASPVSEGGAQRKARRIEVDLTKPQSDEQGESSTQSNLRSRFRLFNGKSKPHQPQNLLSKELAGDLNGRVPKNGELSTAMKLRLIVFGLVVGVVIGALFGKPIVDIVKNYLGIRDAHEERGIARPPTDAEVGAAYARFLEGYPSEGRQRLKDIINNAPRGEHAEASFYLGRIDYAEGKYDEAIDHFGQAMRIDPNRSDFRVHLAMTYLQMAQLRNAKDVLQQVVSPTPETETSPTPTVTSATPGG